MANDQSHEREADPVAALQDAAVMLVSTADRPSAAAKPPVTMPADIARKRKGGRRTTRTARTCPT